MASVELRRLTKRYEAAPVVDAIDLTVEHGLLVCLLGPSGCGKTTTLRLIAGLVDPSGKRWVAADVAFKPHACGTMIHPYIDCAQRIAAKGIRAEDVAEIDCEVGEGTVHRLWEPLAAKRRPPNAYAAKFSTPFCIAAGFVLGSCGLDAFTEATVADERLLGLAAKVGYTIDPGNPYPNAFTGHLRVRLKDGRVVEQRQPFFRGGVNAPLGRAEIEDKFRRNAAYGGWPPERAERFLTLAKQAFDTSIDFTPFRG